jgi:hypothetical protein
MLEFVDVGLGCESGYDEISYGVPLYGRHIVELQFLGEHTKKLSRVGNSFVDMVQVYYLRNMVHVPCFNLEENYLHV